MSDFLGGSAVGYLTGLSDEYQSGMAHPLRIMNVPDTDEYVRIEGFPLEKKEGFYSFQILDQLQEVIYLDKVSLLAIDHPDSVEVYPNERLMPEPPFPPFELRWVKDARPPRRAVDDEGRNILPLIRYQDGKCPDNFKVLSYRGYTSSHSILLDLGDLSQAQKILLMLHSWVERRPQGARLLAEDYHEHANLLG